MASPLTPEELRHKTAWAARRILEDFERLRLYSLNRDGTKRAVRFASLSFNAALQTAFLRVDTNPGQLPAGITLDRLCDVRLLHDLSTVLGYPVYAANKTGLVYVIDYRQPVTPPALPTRVPFRFHDLPAGLRLGVPLGVDARGPHWAALDALGHVLIAGASGSGKSTWIQTALSSLLLLQDPAALQVALIDAKGGMELGFWAEARQLLAPVATTLAEATALLTRLEDEMQRRARLLRQAEARELEEYNQAEQQAAPGIAEPLPRILCVVDEAAALAEQSGKNGGFMLALSQLVLQARAVGIHLWLAGQSANWEILPTRVRDQLSTKIVFRMDSRAAAATCGAPGAETISPATPGRFWCMTGGQRHLLQGYYIETERLKQYARCAAARAPGPRDLPDPLTPAQRRACELARDQLGGAFTINRLVELAGVPQRQLKKWSALWQARGWLVKQPRGLVMSETLLGLLNHVR